MKLPPFPAPWLEKLRQVVRPEAPLGPEKSDAEVRYELGRRALLAQIERWAAAQSDPDEAAHPEL